MKADAPDRLWEELRRQAALLARENARHAEFFEHVPDAYVITDLSGSVREANRAALAMLRTRREDLIGRHFSQFIAEAQGSDVVALALGAMRRPPREVRLRADLHASGGTLAAELSVRPIPLKQGGLGGLCWLVHRAG